MNYKRHATGLALVLSILLLSQAALGNNIQVTNVTHAGGRVQFDLSWDNSWPARKIWTERDQSAGGHLAEGGPTVRLTAGRDDSSVAAFL